MNIGQSRTTRGVLQATAPFPSEFSGHDRRFPSLLAFIALAGAAATAQPVVTNTTTSLYATVPEPIGLDLATDGTLFCGRNSGDGAAAFKIYRVAAGGWPAGEFGNAPILDPDVVIVDAAGSVSGTPGSVLVGGVYSNPLQQGMISKIAPDGTVTALFGPSTDFWNPTAFAFDGPGRLLFTDFNQGRVLVTTGGSPTLLFNLPQAHYLAIDAAGRIVVSSDAESRLRLYTSSGALSNANFAAVRAGSPIARGPGGSWGTDLYAVSSGGYLLRLDPAGNSTVVGSGFASVTYFTFGPDAAMYASELGSDRVYRIAAPAVPGCTTTLYAQVTDPVKLSFAPDGTLFVGRDNAGSGGNNWDAVKIHRVAPGGATVTEYGNSGVTDPDAVFFDAAGTFSGLPGAVIVGGVNDSTSSQGKLVRIAPDGAVTTIFGPSTAMINPSDFVGDSAGRLLFTDYESGQIWVMTNGTPVVLVSGISQPVPVTVDGQDRILVNATAESRVRLYSADGALLTNAFVLAQPRTPLAPGPGGFWGSGVYYVNTNGDLMTVDSAGNTTKAGTAFSGLEDLAFGPDGALYASQLDNDSIWRIAPSLWLSASRSPTNTIIVFWPLPADGWRLETTTNLPSGSGGWTEIPPPYQTNGTDLEFIELSPTGNKFYRLHKP